MLSGPRAPILISSARDSSRERFAQTELGHELSRGNDYIYQRTLAPKYDDLLEHSINIPSNEKKNCCVRIQPHSSGITIGGKYRPLGESEVDVICFL